MNPRNDDGITLATFIRRTKAALHEEHPVLPDGLWKRDWDGICDDHWRFAMAPAQAAEVIAEREGLEP